MFCCVVQCFIGGLITVCCLSLFWCLSLKVVFGVFVFAVNGLWLVFGYGCDYCLAFSSMVCWDTWVGFGFCCLFVLFVCFGLGGFVVCLF